jgi:dTMP kinase
MQKSEGLAMQKGKLIIIESGSDASGKQTQTTKLCERLLAEGYKVKQVTFPNYDSPACMPVKMYLEGEFGKEPSDVNAYVASTFYAIDRFASYKMDWGKFYNEGGIIISDRYTTSNMVHQAVKMPKEERQKYIEWLKELEFGAYGLPVPNGVIFLDVPIHISQELIAGRANKITGEDTKDIHENNKEYLTECYNNSLEIVKEQGWERIECCGGNTLKTVEEIHELIYHKVINLL